MININDFLFERLELSKDSKLKIKFGDRRRNKIDNSKERKDYLKFIEFFKSLGNTPGLYIKFERDDNGYCPTYSGWYKIKYNEKDEELGNLDNPHSYKLIFHYVIELNFESYEDIVESNDIYKLLISTKNLDNDEINDIESLNFSYEKDGWGEYYEASFTTILENIDKIYDLFV